MLAWLSAHEQGGSLRLRIDDLDPNVSSREVEAQQREDLASLGLTFSEPELRQSTRFDHYDEVIERLEGDDLVYPCFCSRREVREATRAPHEHLPEGAYPGTCANLTSEQRNARAVERPAALRIRAEGVVVGIDDRVYGTVSEGVDDFVIRRNDGVPSYNLATVLDDETQGVTEVVRGADLLSGTARHVWLRTILGLRQVEHAHVPLVVNTSGVRLAKRDGAVTLTDLEQRGVSAMAVRGLLAESIGLAESGEQPSMAQLLERYDPTNVPTEEYVWDLGASVDP